jgi:hypothetical protein
MMRIGLTFLLVMLIACSSGETGGSATSTSITSTTVPTTTTIQSTTTTSAPTTTSTIATTTTTVAATTTTLPEFPQTATSITHGGESWAVYLAVAGDFGAPELEEAKALADTYGLLDGEGDLGCDQGGAEALGLDPNDEWAVVSVYFDTEADARQFVDAFEARGHTVAGMGLVLTYCLD